MPIVLKSGSLNLLEPSRPLHACSGIAFPFFFYILWVIINLSYYLGVGSLIDEKDYAVLYLGKILEAIIYSISNLYRSMK